MNALAYIVHDCSAHCTGGGEAVSVALCSSFNFWHDKKLEPKSTKIPTRLAHTLLCPNPPLSALLSSSYWVWERADGSEIPHSHCPVQCLHANIYRSQAGRGSNNRIKEEPGPSLVWPCPCVVSSPFYRFAPVFSVWQCLPLIKADRFEPQSDSINSARRSVRCE